MNKKTRNVNFVIKIRFSIKNVLNILPNAKYQINKKEQIVI